MGSQGFAPVDSSPVRFYTVDALRGVAAVAVLLFHLARNSPQAVELGEALPAPYLAMSDYGRSGVAVFFVLSGFVITYTVRNLGSRPKDALRYSARRQLRLDPPYWAMIAVVLALALAERLVPGLEYQTYSATDVATSAFYVQGFAGTTSVLAVAWTLCLEVQFYLVIVALVLLAGKILRGGDAVGRRRVVRWLAWSLGLLSLIFLAVGIPTGPWFIGSWWMFCLGATVCWYLIGDLGPWATSAALGVALLAAGTAAAVGTADSWGGQWFACTTALLLVVLVALRRLSARPWRWLLYLGSISYSLYLVHLPVIDTVMGGLYRILGSGTAAVLSAYVIGAACAFVAAALLHRWIEVPAIALSRALTTGTRAEVRARSAEAVAHRWNRLGATWRPPRTKARPASATTEAAADES